MNRKERAEKYCCLPLWLAVEQHEVDQLNISFSKFRDEKCWIVTSLDVVGGNLLISYCPWCGSKLPEKPFVDVPHDS